MERKNKGGRPPAGGAVVQIRLPNELKELAARSASTLDTTMSNLIAVVLERVASDEGLARSYVNQLAQRAGTLTQD